MATSEVSILSFYYFLVTNEGTDLKSEWTNYGNSDTVGIEEELKGTVREIMYNIAFFRLLR